MSKNLTSKTANGVKWSTISTVFKAVAQFGYIAIMGRLLDPIHYGVWGFLHIALRFVDYFAKMGMAHAIIQKKELSNEDIRAAFTSSALLGFISAIIVFFLAPLSVHFINTDSIKDIPVTSFEELLIDVMRLSAITFIIQGLSSTSVSLLSRNLEFKVLARNETISTIAYLAVGISMAYAGFGVFSLLVSMLTQFLLTGILSYMATRHSILFIFKWKHFKPLFSYGGQISIISFFEFVMGSLDKMLIGKFLGPVMLGFYERAWQVIYLPIYNVAISVSRVMFSSFSKLQADIEELAKSYKSTITLTALLIFPVCFGVMASAYEIVMVILGEKYEASVNILKVLCIAVPLTMMNTFFSGIVCEATAHLKKKLVITIIQIILLASGFYFVKDYGLLAFAVAFAIGEVIRTVMFMQAIRQILKVTFADLLGCYFPGIFNGAVVGLGIWAITQLGYYIDSPFIITFLMQICTGALLEMMLLLVFPHPLLLVQIHKFMQRFDTPNTQEKFYGKYMIMYLSLLNKKVVKLNS